MLPVGRNLQYILCWYAAETLPPSTERAANIASLGREGGDAELVATKTFAVPEGWPQGLTIRERIDMDGERYEPVKHEGTGVNEEEERYVAELVDVEVARRRLRGTVMEMVVRDAWDIITAERRREERGEDYMTAGT